MMTPVRVHCFFSPAEEAKRHSNWQVHCQSKDIEKEIKLVIPAATSISAALTSFLHLHLHQLSNTSQLQCTSAHLHKPNSLQSHKPTMSRSAADATRFTATSPHAYSKPTPLRSTASTPQSKSTPPYRFPNPNAPRKPPPATPSIPPQTETPAEKVARLRAARFAEIEAQTTTWDRIVLRGRVWADRAHHVTVYAILGFSGTSPPLFPPPLVIVPPKMPLPPSLPPFFSPQTNISTPNPQQSPSA